MNKKSLIASLSVLCLLAGCTKSVSYEDAKKFVNENYSQSTVDSKYSSGKATTENNITKSEGVFYKVMPTGKSSDTNTITLTVLTEAGLSDKYTYKTNGKKLLIDANLSIADLFKDLASSGISLDGATGTAKASFVYNEDGLLESETTTFDFSISTNIVGISATGTLAGTYKTTTEYTKK